MKFFVAVTFITFFVGTLGSGKSSAKEAFATCLSKESVPLSELMKIKSGAYDNGGAERNVQCFANCAFQELGVMNGGVLDEAAVVQKFGPEFGEDKVKGVVDQCKDSPGADECEKAFAMFICIKKSMD